MKIPGAENEFSFRFFLESVPPATNKKLRQADKPDPQSPSPTATSTQQKTLLQQLPTEYFSRKFPLSPRPLNSILLYTTVSQRVCMRDSCSCRLRSARQHGDVLNRSNEESNIVYSTNHRWSSSWKFQSQEISWLMQTAVIGLFYVGTASCTEAYGLPTSSSGLFW